MDRYPIASTVNLDFTVSAAGAGATGETPGIAIQRLTDSFYYDDGLPSGSRFVASFNNSTMTEVDSVNLPGLYRYQFPHSEDTTGSELFLVQLLNSGPNAKIEYRTIAFGALRSAEAPSLCNLFGTVLDINSNPDVNKPVRLSIVPNTILTTGNKPGMSVDRIDTFTDENGQFSVDIIRSLTVRLQIPSIGYDRKIDIPDAASANFADL
jgi:hypothetical protein